MTATKKTSELITKLKRMANNAGEALFERAGMAIEVLSDEQWIADVYKGDRGKAEETIAADCFPDLSMGGWFGRVMILRKHYGEIEKWKKFKFDLQRLWIAYQGDVKPPQPVVEGESKAVRHTPVPWKIHNEVVEEKKSLEYQVRRQKDVSKSWEDRYHDLERDLRNARLELAEAQGRIKTLEMMLDRRPELAVA